ncbi:hypothetical protein KCU65_g2321, partial [Aureobasidium melanogenum]
MANPNQGPPGPDPNPGPDLGSNPGPDLPVHDIDLRDPIYISDGQNQQPQTTVDVKFLNCLSICFNHQPNFVTTLGYNVNFIGGLPQGYVLESRERRRFLDRERLGSLNPVNQRMTVDHYIHGHPRGRSFTSVNHFARHVYHIMRNDLANCDCNRC